MDPFLAMRLFLMSIVFSLNKIIILLPILFVFFYVVFKRKKAYKEDVSYLNLTRPEIELKRKEEENDKLIIVQNVNRESIKKVVQQICNLYNADAYKLLPRIIEFSDRKFAIFFPYNIRFEEFCYVVNYLYYPQGLNLDYEPIIKGWTTICSNDLWVTQELVGKKISLFIPSGDQEYNNVYFVTEANKVYKAEFSVVKRRAKLSSYVSAYTEPEINLSFLREFIFEDFK